MSHYVKQWQFSTKPAFEVRPICTQRLSGCYQNASDSAPETNKQRAAQTRQINMRQTPTINSMK